MLRKKQYLSYLDSDKRKVSLHPLKVTTMEPTPYRVNMQMVPWRQNRC